MRIGSFLLTCNVFFFGGWGKPGCGGRIMLETGESGYFDTISMGFFFLFVLFSLYCFTDIHEI